MQRDPRAASRKLPPAFFMRDLVEAENFSVEFSHLIDLGGKQDHARHFHCGHLYCAICLANFIQSSRGAPWCVVVVGRGKQSATERSCAESRPPNSLLYVNPLD